MATIAYSKFFQGRNQLEFTLSCYTFFTQLEAKVAPEAMLLNPVVLSKLMQVFVLLFNARTDNEGIHTLKLNDPEAGAQDVVLAFEVEDDATRFALLLEAQDFPTATVEAIDMDELEEFCQGAGLELKLVTEGTLAVPPESHVEETDWQPDRPASSAPESDLDRIRRQLEGLL